MAYYIFNAIKKISEKCLKEARMIRFNVDPASPIPIYQQVKQTILIEILSGRLKEGDRLPPIRVLAKILKINPNTVAKVYYNLDDEGYIKALCLDHAQRFVRCGRQLAASRS